MSIWISTAKYFLAQRTMRSIALCLLLTPVFLTSQGCAALFTGTSEQILFMSEPQGATVKVGETRGTTPCTLEVSKSVKNVTFTHPDYPEREVDVDRDFMWGFLLMDIFFTPGYGLSGILIDAPTSAYFNMPDLINVDLTRSPLAESITDNEKSRS